MFLCPVSHLSQVAQQLRFPSLFQPGRGFSFSCDANGVVRLETLSPIERASYARVIARVGRDLGFPSFEAITLH